MKGIILAGGSGTRLWPSTKVISKQILPVYDKPTVYYPLSTLMLAGVKDILIISTPRDVPIIKDLLGNGKKLGLNISYEVQDQPNGIAQAFIIGADFIGDDSVYLILGDNLFYGHELSRLLKETSAQTTGASVFCYKVSDPERYGVIEFDKDQKAISIEEKPKQPKSSWAVTGLYFYDNQVVEIAKNLKPSDRGELEITDINKAYLERDQLNAKLFSRGVAWLDTGTPDALLASANFVSTLEKRQGLKISCIEEIALHKGFIDKDQFVKLIEEYGDTPYGDYLKKVLNEHG